jgi:hypothetical protein
LDTYHTFTISHFFCDFCECSVTAVNQSIHSIDTQLCLHFTKLSLLIKIETFFDWLFVTLKSHFWHFFGKKLKTKEQQYCLNDLFGDYVHKKCNFSLKISRNHQIIRELFSLSHKSINKSVIIINCKLKLVINGLI